MPAVARVNDKVNMNCPHGGIGTIVSGSPNVDCEGNPVARIGDKVVCDSCGQTFTIITGSPTGFANSLAIARVGDLASGTCNPGLPCCHHGISNASIITGSPTHTFD